MRAILKHLMWLLWPLLVIAARAQPIAADVAVPAPLEPWRAWVMHDQEFRACPLIAGTAGKNAADFLCAWPGVLRVDVRADGADLVQQWQVDTDSWIPLAGDSDNWPQQVTMDGRPVVVVDRNGPVVRAEPGRHDLRAHIPWQQRPQRLQVPDAIGLVDLRVDGKPVIPILRDSNGLILGRSASATKAADSLSLHVYRLLADGVPAELSTRISLDASGQAREVEIGPVLPPGFIPLALNGDWPARFDNDGRLRIQVQPGHGNLELTARATAPLDKVEAQLAPKPWPEQEIWSYADAPHLRVTSASGALQVDPGQAQVPREWQSLPAFALGDGDALSIEQRSRGVASDDGNRFTLAREMWLDFDGNGWYATDRISGTMVQGWRFDVAAPWVLEHAAGMDNAPDNTSQQGLLVTRGAQPDLTGVEWRTPRVNLRAGLRAPGDSTLPVSGWQQRFDGITSNLHLPPGYRLLGAPGADTAHNSWMAGWTLLDVFIAAILVLVAWRLFGLMGTLVVIAYLLLGYQEPGSPLWSLLAVIALALIVRALPAGRLGEAAGWARIAVLALVILISLPFVADQVRFALYPQLESEGSILQTIQVTGSGVAEAERAAMGKASPPSRAPMIAQEAMPMSVPAPPPAPPSPPAPGSASGAGASVSIGRYVEGTVVQTGSGAPNWSLGHTYLLSWDGPVLPTQSVHLVVAPSWLVRALRLVLVALLAWLIARLAQPVARDLAARRKQPAERNRAAHVTLLFATLLGVGLAGAGLAFTPAAQAQTVTFPPDSVLNELRTRVTAAPKCAPECAAIADADVMAQGDNVRIALEVHAAANVAVPLPIDVRNPAVTGVTLDGAPADGIVQHDGKLWIAVARGVHRVELTYRTDGDDLALAFPLAPEHVRFAAEGWQAKGISDDRLLTDTLNLVRARESLDTPAATAIGQQFPPFVRVARSINLGLDWTVVTEVTRLAPVQGGFTVAIPLLAGEHVATADRRVTDGKVIAAIGENASVTNWSSKLDKGDSLTLTAPAFGDHAEVWHVRFSPTWHVAFTGVPPVTPPRGTNRDAYRDFEFHPLPGETLAITMARPVPIKGEWRALDGVQLVTEIGDRARTGILTLQLRTTQGGEHPIGLPADAELVSVSRGRQVLNLRLKGGKLALPLRPGAQTFELRFRQNMPTGLVMHAPQVDLGLPAANINLGMQLPGNRWLLLTHGPLVGPAVLYWGELIVMLLIASALVRTRRTSLKFWQWTLLGLGFSTFSWFALIIVVLWLFALDWRERTSPLRSVNEFNLTQIGIALLTFAALGCVIGAIPQGLLGEPNMHVTGNGSSAQMLRWFADRSTDALPTVSAVSLPLWTYKLAMLAWALWLANALVGWLRRGFAAWMKDGYWRTLESPLVDVPSTQSPAPPPAPPSL